MTAMPEVSALEAVEETDRAELLLHPLRQMILEEAREASTAAEIARRVGLPPQKVNYHVRTLVDAGFLKPAGEGLKRNLVEKRYRASAESYLLLPAVLGEVGTRGPSEAERFSAMHLMHLSALLQTELAASLGVAEPDEVPTLSLEAEIAFESPEQRNSFARALQRAVARIIALHTDPTHDTRGRSRAGRAYRLVVGCYPIPPADSEEAA